MPVKNLLRTEITNNWERHPRVTGRILRLDEQSIEGPKGVEVVPYILVESGNRFVRVYKSAALEEMFSVAKVGLFVDIESVGMRTTKSNRQCRQLDVRVWEDTDAPAVDPVKVKARRGPLAEEEISEAPNAKTSKARAKRS
jgi:hypothetical protein